MAATFTFRLQPLLEARRRAEQQVQREVAELERRRLDLEADLRRHQAMISGSKVRMRDGLVGSLDVRTLRLGAGSTLHAIRAAQQIVLQLAGLSEHAQAARARLLQATTRRRALERLRDRRREQWKARLERAETAALDELAGQAAARTENPR